MKTRTSQTDPLRIAEVGVATGTIGITFMPGKIGPSVNGARWNRDLAQDMKVIEGWKANSIVSLVEAFEFEDLQVFDFQKAVASVGADWHHLPIVDVSTPGPAFERLWAYHGHVLRERLRQGGRVLVHCRGGLGRAGMIASRLLVELGVDPELAMKQVRRVRAGAIETREQEDYVRQCRTVSDDAHRARILGCLLGGAVGDAFGLPVEFMQLREIKERYGAEGITGPDLDDNGKWIASDDTQMTLFTVEGLVDGLQQETDLLGAIRTSYLAWLRTQKPPFVFCDDYSRMLHFAELWERRAPGITCLAALEAGGNGSIERPINDSKGCGGVMRTAPIGLVKSFDAAKCMDLGARAAALTHGHPSGFWSAGAVAAIVRDLVDGCSLDDATQRVIDQLKTCAGSEELIDLLELALNDDVRKASSFGGGWVGVEALAMAIFAVRRGKSLPEVLKIASNHDGDSDSTASIAGQIWGAREGLRDLPMEWVQLLDLSAPAFLAASRLFEVA
jgi:ADP-ribosyl-[dinitrogen reductase] hydrolase